MKIDSITNGIVIDHILAGKGMELYHFLHLDSMDCSIALIKNAPSQKMGKKDIIKVDTALELDLDILGYVDPGARKADKYHTMQKSALHHLCGAGNSAYL